MKLGLQNRIRKLEICFVTSGSYGRDCRGIGKEHRHTKERLTVAEERYIKIEKGTSWNRQLNLKTVTIQTLGDFIKMNLTQSYIPK